MDKKYELTEETINHFDRTLYRIRALKALSDVKVGDLGGYIEKEDNLSHYGNAQVYGNARICGDGYIQSTRDYFVAGPLGSRNDFTTFFKTKGNDIKVACGCFKGTIDEFVGRVKETHGTSAYGQEYCGIVDFVKNYLNLIKE